MSTESAPFGSDSKPEKFNLQKWLKSKLWLIPLVALCAGMLYYQKYVEQPSTVHACTSLRPARLAGSDKRLVFVRGVVDRRYTPPRLIDEADKGSVADKSATIPVNSSVVLLSLPESVKTDSVIDIRGFLSLTEHTMRTGAINFERRWEGSK